MSEVVVHDTAFDAVVLAGGHSRRMGGGDKTALPVGGVPLLDRALRAVAQASAVIVVGDERPTTRAVTWARERPSGAGPAAAVAAGVALTGAPLVAVLAGDLPFVTGATVARLLASARPNGAVLVDEGGAPQWLLGAWPREVLVSALSGDQTGRALRSAFAAAAPGAGRRRRRRPAPVVRL